MYSGTHDNNTSLGWYADLDETTRCFVTKFLGCSPDTFLHRFLRLAFMSASRLCIIPYQDVLGRPGSDRMNVPGTMSGNWRWRMKPSDLSIQAMTPIREFTEVYGREPDKDFIL
jgi:4-alpha-glucanotransferase